MPLETGTYISDLVSSNPAHTDSINNADAHMRLIKSTIKATFPGVEQAMTAAAGSAFQVVLPDGTSSAPAYSFAGEPTLGIYRPSAGVLRVAGGRLLGTAPVGSLHMFLVEPQGLGKGGVGTGHDFLELDGATWNTADFIDLANHLGAAGSTFTVPNSKNTGRFLRSRTSTLAAGTYQTNQMVAHTHSVSGTTNSENQTHTHSFSGSTGNESNDHTHVYQQPGTTSTFQSGPYYGLAPGSSNSTGGASDHHTHSFSGTTASENTYHTHNFSVTSGSAGAGTETRPEALVVIMCIKT